MVDRGAQCRGACSWAERFWSIIRSAGPDAFVDRDRKMTSGEITIRVRYAETDRMGLLHHANYLVYFEQGRTELLRSCGLSYKDLEDQGYLLVLTKIEVKYRWPAHYDDLLTLKTIVTRTTSVRIDHRYELYCQGRPQALPDILREGPASGAC